MAVLSKQMLFQKIKDAVELDGWQLHLNSDINQHPIRVDIKKNKATQNLRVYIWNLSHGGASRPENEYRIQVKVDRFEEESNSKVLILGYWDEGNVFAGFDIRKHIGKPGWSASMQIKKEYLENAQYQAVSVYNKGSGETVVAFRPDFFVTYVNHLDELHQTGNVSKFINGNVSEVDDDIFEDEADEETIPFRYSITSYGADYVVDMIVKRISDNVIFVPPFQRQYVWSLKEASRFIESLILGLPVPGIFLSKESDTGRMLIVDGQQRLFSLYSFYENNFKGNEFRLNGVSADLDGKSYNELSSTDKTTLNDAIIHATIIKQDEPNNDDSSIYLIFERLNSSGRALSSQEVRACVFYGDFNQYLNKVVLETNWRAIFGKMNERLKEQEMLLRFFALYFNLNEYEKPLAKFLNGFMKANRNLEIVSDNNLDTIILPLIDFIKQTLGRTAFRLGRSINVSVFDAVMVGLAKRFENGAIQDTEGFLRAYAQLLTDNDFVNASKEGTSDKPTVLKRINLATEKFKNLR